MFDFNKLNDHGLRMLQTAVYRLEFYRLGIGIEGENFPETTDEIKKVFIYNQMLETLEWSKPDEWNKAEGFVHYVWIEGARLCPTLPGYDYSELVAEKFDTNAGVSYGVAAYDIHGRELNFKISVETSPHSLEDTTFSEWFEKEKQNKKEQRQLPRLCLVGPTNQNQLALRDVALAKLSQEEIDAIREFGFY